MIKERNSGVRAGSAQIGPLVSWHTDHLNFARLLDLVEQQVDAFHKGKLPDYELMRSIVYYLRHYRTAFITLGKTSRSPALSSVIRRCG